MTFLKQKKNFLAQPVAFYALLGSVHQTHKVVFLLFDGHLTAIFDATKLPQFLVLPIYPGICFSLHILCYGHTIGNDGKKTP